MEVYKVSYGTQVIVEDDSIRIPPDALPVNNGDLITILNTDGMYTNGLNVNDEKIYIAAWTNVELTY